MRRVLKGLGALALIVLACVTALWVGTRGDYVVPALVTEDESLASATLAGTRLHLRQIDGPPDADTLIVLHGGPGGDFRSLLALRALSDTHRVVFYDQRGSGLSERVREEDLTLDGYLTELDAVIAHAAPSGSVSLIGHSWGAMLASAYLGTAPDRIDRVILIEPGYLDAAGQQAWREESHRYLSGPSFWKAAVLNGFRAAHVTGPDSQAADDFLIGRMVAAFAGHADNPYHCGSGYGAPGWRFGAAASATWDTAPAADIDRIALGTKDDRPVLILAGACNTWLGAPLQMKHAQRFANAQLTVIPDAGHDVVWDNPDAALAAIRDFLQQK